jgi:chemotaxis protein CheD
VPEANIDFVRAFLRMEQVAVVKEDVGGYAGRKILFFPETAKVLLKRLETSVDSNLIRAEETYKTRLFREKERLQQAGGDLTLF